MKHTPGVMLQRWTSAESMCEWYYLMEGLHYVFPSFLSCKRWSQLSYESPTALAGQLCPSAAKRLGVSREKEAVHIVQHLTEAEKWARSTRKTHGSCDRFGYLAISSQSRNKLEWFHADINDKPLKKLHLLSLGLHKVTLIWYESNYCRSSLVTPREKFEVCVVSWIFIATLVINQREPASIQLNMPQTSRTEITVVLLCCGPDIKFCASPLLHLVRTKTSQTLVCSLECYKNEVKWIPQKSMREQKGSNLKFFSISR